MFTLVNLDQIHTRTKKLGNKFPKYLSIVVSELFGCVIDPIITLTMLWTSHSLLTFLCFPVAICFRSFSDIIVSCFFSFPFDISCCLLLLHYFCFMSWIRAKNLCVCLSEYIGWCVWLAMFSLSLDLVLLQKTGWIYFHFLFLYSGLEYTLCFLTHLHFSYTRFVCLFILVWYLRRRRRKYR